MIEEHYISLAKNSLRSYSREVFSEIEAIAKIRDLELYWVFNQFILEINSIARKRGLK